jgi:molybdopterin-binding protein
MAVFRRRAKLEPLRRSGVGDLFGQHGYSVPPSRSPAQTAFCARHSSREGAAGTEGPFEAAGEVSHKLNREFAVGDKVQVKLYDGRIVDATVRAVVDEGEKLQVDFGHEQTALVKASQVVG